MGMFDSYYASKDFKCPFCGVKIRKEDGFQSKELECLMSCYKLGDKIDESRRYVDFYDFCPNRHDRYDYSKPKDKKGEYPLIPASCEGIFNCRIVINDKGFAEKEIITAHKEDKEVLVYEVALK